MKPVLNESNGWTTARVAQELGVKLRTVHNLVLTKRLHPQRFSRPGIKGGVINLFDPTEIEAFMQKRVARKTEVLPATAPGPLVPVRRVRQVRALEVSHSAPELPVDRKLYLTLEEAIAYTGLGGFHIEKNCNGRPIGPKGKTVYNREDLGKL